MPEKDTYRRFEIHSRLFRCHSPTFSSMLPFPNRDAGVHRDWPADVRYVAAEDGARIAEKGELGVALGNDRPLAFIRVQIRHVHGSQGWIYDPNGSRDRNLGNGL